ncbi:MAG TPA: ABC transporter permease [Gemmatimonadales bacterium]
MSRLELAIAWRYLRSRRGSRLLSFISVIAIGGVVVGVSALILITAVMNGLQRDLRDKILIGSPDLRVLTYGDMRIGDWEALVRRVEERPGVVAAGPVALAEVVVQLPGNAYSEGVQIAGIQPAGPDVAEPTDIRQHAVRGGFEFLTSGGDRRGLVLGRFLADRLLVGVGDSLTVFGLGNGDMNPLTGMPMPLIMRLEITGVFETGLYEYDNKFIYTSLPVVQELAGLGDAVTAIEVKTTDRWRTDAVTADLDSTLGMPYRTLDWQEQNRNLFQALKLEKLGMTIILLLIVLVAAFNIVSTLTMVVTDKTREIGILKAMGMRARSIRNVFLVQGVVIGLVGTLLGLGLGLLAAYLVGDLQLIKLDPAVYFIDHLPVSVELADVVLIVVASLGIAAFATLYPARQASRLFPIEAIRHE